jgi:glycosyltransferase involved in cell wall biosynthesis
MIMSKINVLLVTPSLALAGAENAVATLARALDKSHCQVTVCCLYAGGPLQRDLDGQEGIEVEILRLSRHRFFLVPLFLRDVARFVRELAGVALEHHADVIHTCLDANLIGPLSAAVAGTPVTIWTIQNVTFLGKYGGPLRLLLRGWVHRLLVGRVDSIVAVSDEVNRAFCDFIDPRHRNKVVTIPNAVDLARVEVSPPRDEFLASLGLTPDNRLLLTVGRLDYQKGHDILIQAAQQVVVHHRNVRFLFAGDGMLRETLEAQVRSAGLSQHIRFLGIRQDVPELLAVSEVFVLPSRWEGLSVALLEAMAAAKPVVATAVSGTIQVVEHGISGIVVPSESPEALTDGIITSLDNPDQATRMGQEARQRIKAHYSSQANAAAHLELYQRLLSNVALRRSG